MFWNKKYHYRLNATTGDVELADWTSPFGPMSQAGWTNESYTRKELNRRFPGCTFKIIKPGGGKVGTETNILM